MSPELQTTLVWVILITLFLIGLLMLSGPVVLLVVIAGITAVIGVFVGDLFGQPVIGAITGWVIGVIGFVVIVTWDTDKQAARKSSRLKQSNQKP